MHFLRLSFIALIAASAILVLSLGTWEGHLVRRDGIWIVGLPVKPIWSPPPMPNFETFHRTFADLPPKMNSDATIVRVFRFDTALLEFLFCATIAAGLSGLLNFMTRRGSRDAMLHYALFIAVGMATAAASCFVLWLLLGGWWPPYPILFAFLGIACGICLGRWRWETP